MTNALPAIVVPELTPGKQSSEFKLSLGALAAWVIVTAGLVLHHDWHALAAVAQGAVATAGPAIVALYGLERSYVKGKHQESISAFLVAHAAEIRADVGVVAKAAAPLRKPKPVAAAPPTKT